MTPAVAVASLALIFTVSSFWWIQVRKGRLVSYEAKIFGVVITPGTFRLRLPLAVYNSGASALVVTDLRLEFEGTGQTVPMMTFRETVRPTSGDWEDFVRPYAVPGRQVVSKVVEFGSDGKWTPEPDKRYSVRVDVRVGTGDWQELVTMPLTMPKAEKAKYYTACRACPDDDE